VAVHVPMSAFERHRLLMKDHPHMSHTAPESEPTPTSPAPVTAVAEVPTQSGAVQGNSQFVPAQMPYGSVLASAVIHGKSRGPFAVWLLSLVTLGIYGLVWYFKINRELRDFHPSIQVKPGLALLALFVPIAGWVSIYNTGKRIGQAQQLAGLGTACSGGLGLVAAWFFALHMVYFQGQLNRVWNGR
jgi:hypothetical protein